ncbi:symplekin isoform X1 [Periplaneta americana]|uniref:symplekin isoform X1 n=1 Tax=Periplaneta americana TaxID=6978 RepID=UPI0037E7D77F
MDSRRSTAAQFFMEEDDHELSTGTSYNKIVEWLNHASLTSDNLKTDYLHRVQEIIIKKDASLLDNFLDEVLGFQNDRNADVRKFIVGFIEEACKKDPDVLPKVVANLSMLLQDSSVQVQKRVIQAASQVYRGALAWLARARAVTEEMEAAWAMMGSIKAQIVNMIDSDNDGIRTHSVKFLECVVLLQTYPEAESMRRENDFSLEDVPLTLKIARRRKLEEEANMVFELLIKFHGSPHVSSVNLMTCMGSLTLIAKMRPQFMGKVIAALETLHTNLPPTLSKSQVSSVRKHLKMQLLNLLKHPSSVDYYTNITTLLTDLGATYQEVLKSYPKIDELRKRQKRVAESMASQTSSVSSSKKPRLDMEDDDEEEEEEEEGMDERRSVDIHHKKHTDLAIDVTEQFIVERLSPDLAAQIVMVSMAKLPDTMPAHFSAMYTPIAAAGTQGQIKHVARLIATQLTAVGLGPGAKQAKKLQVIPKATSIDDEDDEISSTSKTSLSTVVSGMMDKEKDGRSKATLLPSGGSLKAAKQRIKTLKLSEITKPLEKETMLKMMADAVQRILKAERDAALGGVSAVRNKIITTLAASFKRNVREVVLSFLLDDLRSQLDLGFAWLYEEYSFMQGFNRMPGFLKQEHSIDENYNTLLCTMASNLIERAEMKDRDVLLARLYLEAPLITEEATDLLKNMCSDETRAPVGLHLLQDLVIRRPPKQLIFLNALLLHTAHENPEVRSRAIKCVVDLYDRGDLRSIIEEYAIFYLGFLRLPQPPDVLFGMDRGRPVKIDMWNEDIVRVCLYLYLALLPINENLIHELARVYVQTVADVKRTILRLLEQPVRGMGMDSPQLLTLVEECPKGAETLVTRVIHILTDKTPPSAELVARVRDLYHTRVSDVRFLIPVLNGLTKKEVIAALPKLIKLNPVVVKEVFNRLLGTHSESMSHTSPLTPAELLIALHNIDPTKCELKTVIKATSMCFAEKQAYTQEVLAVVMQHLMELNPLPTLLMRTVIQSLSLYPRLIGFVMNILQRLIMKQVWKQKKVWEGFIKCCQRTKPQSFQVLLQLPPAQLSDVLTTSPDLQQPLVSHVMAFTENQRAHIPQSIMDVLLGNRRPHMDEYDVKMEAVSPTELTIDIKEESEELRSEPAPPGMD